MVQLLTPSGDRVADPHLGPRGWPMSPMSSSVRSTRTSSSSAASTPRPPRCNARGNSGCGRRCSARRPRRSARPARCASDDFVFTSYRENAVAYCRGVELADLVRGLARHCPRPAGTRTTIGMATPHVIIGAQTLHATGYAHGLQERRRRLRRRRLLRRRRHQPGRRQRGHGLRRQLPGPGRLLLPEQPVGDLRAGRPAGAAARSPIARPGSASPACASTATTCSPCMAATRVALDRARARRRPDVHRGRHLPDGPAHDVRRPHPLRGPATSSEDWAAKDPIARLEALLEHAGPVRRRASRPPSHAKADAVAAAAARRMPRPGRPRIR